MVGMLMSGNPVYDGLITTGSVKRGHFVLSSGLHSSGYIQCSQILSYPEKADWLGKLIKDKVPDKFDLVVSPAMGGIIIGQSVAKAAGCQAFFTERVNGEMILRRGFKLPSQANILIVEDVVTSGRSALEVIRCLGNLQEFDASLHRVIGVACIVDRRELFVSLGVPMYSLIHLDLKTSSPISCPQCQDGTLRAEKPGSRP